MEYESHPASMVIVGDLLMGEHPGPMLVLDREPKMIDHRVRLILLQMDGTRVCRTYPPTREVSIKPWGAARVLQDSSRLQAFVSTFLEAKV